MAATDYDRIEGFSLLRRTGQDKWQAQLGWRCEDSAIRELENIWYGQVFPGFSGGYAPVCVSINSQKGALGTKVALVTMQFETLRQPGFAEIKSDIKQSQVFDRVDADGLTIEGFAPVGVIRYRVDRGRNYRQDNHIVYVVETAYDLNDSNQHLWKDWMWHVNSEPVRRLDNHPSKTLLFEGRRRWRPPGTSLVYIDYVFDWYPIGWNKYLECGQRTGFSNWSIPFPRRLYDTASFRHIDTLVIR